MWVSGEPALASCMCMSVQGSKTDQGIRLVSKVLSCSPYVTCSVFSLPYPTALLYKPIDRVTRSTLVLHVSVSPLCVRSPV